MRRAIPILLCAIALPGAQTFVLPGCPMTDQGAARFRAADVTLRQSTSHLRNTQARQNCLTAQVIHTSCLKSCSHHKRSANLSSQAQAQGTDTPWKVVKNTAARTAFVLNQWKSVAENSRSLGWTSSSEEAMIKLRREAATADAMKTVIPKLMQRAVMDKAIEENGKAPDGVGDIEHLGVTLAVSVGSGSACALYHKSPDQTFWRIDHLVANTAMSGQLETQRFVVQQVVKDAEEVGVNEVRLASSCYDDMTGTIYGSLEQLGFQQPEASADWCVHKK